MTKQSVQQQQQRQAAKPEPAASRAATAGPADGRLAQLSEALNGGAARQLAPKKKKLAQRAPKKKLAQLAPKKKLAQMAPKKKKPAQMASKKKPAQMASKKKLAQLATKKKPLQRAANATGLPDKVKSGVEALSGLSMDHVRVHYNSPKPAQLNAHAFAQGSDIHVAPGQQHHVPHEAWHVVQQAEGRVRPTLQMRTGVAVNDDPGLEREADVMGARAVQMVLSPDAPAQLAVTGPAGGAIVQRAVPTGIGLPKPVPQTGNYNAQAGARNTYFTEAAYPRSKFSFGVYTRPTVLANFNATGVGTHASTVMTSTGHQANTQAVQLDHYPVSWTKIAHFMDAHNRQQEHDRVPLSADHYYTLWDARMYYNDITNLKPAMGSDNASGGAEGVQVAAPMHEHLQAALGYAIHSMTALQGVLGAYHESFQEDHLGHVSEMLTEIGDHASKLSEKIQTFK